MQETNLKQQSLTKDDYTLWLNQPITKRLMNTLNINISSLKEQLTDTNYLLTNTEKESVYLLGMLRGLEFVRDIDIYDEIPEEVKDDKEPQSLRDGY